MKECFHTLCWHTAGDSQLTYSIAASPIFDPLPAFSPVFVQMNESVVNHKQHLKGAGVKKIKSLAMNSLLPAPLKVNFTLRETEAAGHSKLNYSRWHSAKLQKLELLQHKILFHCPFMCSVTARHFFVAKTLFKKRKLCMKIWHI